MNYEEIIKRQLKNESITVDEAFYLFKLCYKPATVDELKPEDILLKNIKPITDYCVDPCISCTRKDVSYIGESPCTRCKNNKAFTAVTTTSKPDWDAVTTSSKLQYHTHE